MTHYQEIALFVAMKDKDVPQPGNPTFLSDLAFLTGITQHLNTLNLQLQGQKQVITLMYNCIKSFKCKLSLWAKQLAAGNLAHLSSLQVVSEVEAQRLKDNEDVVSELLAEFDRRFQEFKDLEPQFALFATPFAVDAESISEEVQMELLNLQCDTVLKQKYTDVGVPEFHTFLSREKYPKLVSAAAEIMAMFGSTYVCEQFFSSMKINKSAL